MESFKKWREEGRCIPRFQDLEENDYIEEDRAWSFTMWLLRTRYVVSHAWLTAAHPDPQGVQLDSLMCELAKCNKWKFWKRIFGCHDVVFFDYASLPQNGPNGQKRNDEEKELFNKALKGMNVLYSHNSFQVLVIPDVPEGRQYKDRVWCYTELAISTAHGRAIRLQVQRGQTPDQAGGDARVPKHVLPQVGRQGLHEQRRQGNDNEDILRVFQARGTAGYALGEVGLRGVRQSPSGTTFRRLWSGSFARNNLAQRFQKLTLNGAMATNLRKSRDR